MADGVGLGVGVAVWEKATSGRRRRRAAKSGNGERGFMGKFLIR
jgi:hypothetical protein